MVSLIVKLRFNSNLNLVKWLAFSPFDPADPTPNPSIRCYPKLSWVGKACSQLFLQYHDSKVMSPIKPCK